MVDLKQFLWSQRDLHIFASQVSYEVKYLLVYKGGSTQAKNGAIFAGRPGIR